MPARRPSCSSPSASAGPASWLGTAIGCENGMGTQVDKVEGFKWHLVAKTAGKGDPELDKQLADLPADDRAKAEAAARKWLGSK